MQACAELRWSEVTNERARGVSVPAVFKSIVKAHGNRIAVQQHCQRLDYCALDTASNQLARVLARHGVEPGSYVGLMVDRSLDAIVLCLAVLKLGAAYLPLDPSYPAASLAMMIDDARPDLVVSTRTRGHQTAAPRVAMIEDLNGEAALEDASDISVELDGETPAYVMYTSGSTGRPKGVIIPQRGIIRLVCDTNFASFGPDDTLLEIGPLAFDYSTLEIFGMLLNGGRIAVLPDRVPTLSSIADGIKREGATCLCLTPALFHLLVDHKLEGLAPLNQLFVSGDVVSTNHVDRFLKRYPHCHLHNACGHTENTTFTTCYTVPRVTPDVSGEIQASSAWGGGPVPIGTPIAQTTAYVLDDNNQPVSNGSVGTLWTGGAGVALGYLNLADLTRERFRPDPFSTEVGALMYNTGDLVFERPDGALGFVGRSDRQIKCGGKRIELNAIEANLRSDARVRDAAVTFRTLPSAEKEIVAFIALHSDADARAAPEVILADTASVQPAFMLPARLIVVSKMPMTSNGKVDRASLLRDFEEAAIGSPAAPDAAAAATDLAGQLERIWCQVLHRDRIDRTANFFDVGGSSLRMIEVQAHLTRALNRDIAITDLFTHSTIGSLADFLTTGDGCTSAVRQAREAGDRQRRTLMRLRASGGKRA